MKLIGTLTWTVAVCNFHFTARHFAGIKNKTADSLSRLLQQFRHFRGRQGPSDLSGATTVNLGLNYHNLNASTL